MADYLVLKRRKLGGEDREVGSILSDDDFNKSATGTLTSAGVLQRIPVAATISSPPKEDEEDEDGGGEDAAPQASDAAKAKAEELGVDLSEVEGTGAGGNVVVKDVEDHAGEANKAT